MLRRGRPLGSPHWHVPFRWWGVSEVAMIGRISSSPPPPPPGVCVCVSLCLPICLAHGLIHHLWWVTKQKPTAVQSAVWIIF